MIGRIIGEAQVYDWEKNGCPAAYDPDGSGRPIKYCAAAKNCSC